VYLGGKKNHYFSVDVPKIGPEHLGYFLLDVAGSFLPASEGQGTGE
jgi:hypothetical protein